MKQRDIPKFDSTPSLLGKQMPTDLIMNMDDIVAADGDDEGCYKTWTLDYGLDSGPRKVPYAHASVCTAWLLLRLYCVYQLAIYSLKQR